MNGKKWNGIEKENSYCYGKIYKYVGEFLNGKKWKGTIQEFTDAEYYEDYYKPAQLIFEGKYLNGKIRFGKEYNKNKKLKYEGELLNRQRNGIGKQFYEEYC